MNEYNNQNYLFPEFERFVAENEMLLNLKGNFPVKIHKIIGKGQTKADGLNLPPAPIERKMELATIEFPQGIDVPPAVLAEIASVQTQLKEELKLINQSDGIRRLAITALRSLQVPTGIQDNYYFAGTLVLVPKKRAESWAWCLTPHYPIIPKIPPDSDYIEKAYYASEKLLKELILPVEEFDFKLNLSWIIARQFSNSDDVFVVDVARMYKVAGQRDQFWKAPKRTFFNDLPDAAFIANLINWRRQMERGKSTFEFVEATLHQAHGPNAKPFYMPVNPEGTRVKPVIFLRKVN
jgi:hypothetical protein